jgi:spermidine synthase
LAWDEAVSPSESAREIRQISRAVIACFLISGAVGLVYEVLWIRMLGLVFGYTVFAMTTVLASFMGGLGLGSYVFGRIADRSTRLLTFYGSLEIGIGLYCFLLPTLLDRAAGLYLWVSRIYGLSYISFSAIQFCLVALLLVPPTCLMGATLPVLVRFFVREETTLGRQVGLLYSVNTLGAVFGALLAGYWLVPTLGIHTTLRLAVVMNIGIGSLVIVFDRHLRRLAVPAAAGSPRPVVVPVEATPISDAAWNRTAWIVASGFCASGAASMIYEVTWTRTLSLIIGSSTYAFTAMLVAFLCGIAGGSWAFSRIAGKRKIQAKAFGLLQVGIGVGGLVLIPVFGRMPVWFLELFQFSQAPWFVQLIQFGVSFAVMLLPTLLIGATFPCVVRVLSRGVGRVGNDTGWIYAVNTAGAILGTTLAGFLGVPFLGVQWAMRIGVLVNLCVGAVVLLTAGERERGRLRGLLTGAAVAAAVAAVMLPPWDPALMSSGVAIYGPRYLSYLRAGEFGQSDWQPEVLYYRDGVSATVSVHRDGPRLSLRVNGKTDAGNTGDMHTQLFSGHIPMLLHPNPKRVLVIGLGSGVTAGAVARYPVEQIDVIEIEPAVVEASRFFATENRNVLADPRVRLIVADGRNFLMNVSAPYDVIISEPSNPWIRGLATLFTREFFALAKSRLAPDGLMLQWLQSYSLAPDDLRMVAATFRTAFPHSAFWNTQIGDNFLLGSPGPLAIPLDRIQLRFDELPGVREDFARVGFHTPVGLLADYLLDPRDLARFSDNSPLNTDDTLWLEFSAPRSLYEVGNAELNYRILRSYRSTDLPPMSVTDQARVATAAGRGALGRAFLGKGFPTEAEAEFARAVRLDPLHTDSLLGYAQVLIQRGMALQAVQILDQVLSRNGKEAQAHFLMGTSYQHQGMPGPALEAFRRATEAAPDNADYRLRLAALLRERRDWGQAQIESEMARRLRPADPAVLIPLAEVLLAQGKAADVQALLRPILADPKAQTAVTRGKLQHLVGAAHLQAKQTAEAIATLEAAIRLNPLEPGPRLDLSQAYETSGDLQRAAATLDRLLSLQPDNLLALQRFNALMARMEDRSS